MKPSVKLRVWRGVTDGDLRSDRVVGVGVADGDLRSDRVLGRETGTISFRKVRSVFERTLFWFLSRLR